MIAVKSLWPLIKESVSQWSDDYAPSMGAALAYYTIFSIAPLLVITIAVAGFVFGAEAAHGEIFSQLRGVIGDDGATAIQGLVKSASETGKGTFAAIAGVVTLLLGATTVFGELQSDLDRIWDAPKSTESGIKTLLKGRLHAFGMILGVGFLLLVSLVLSAGLSALAKFWDGWFAGWEWALQAVNFVVSFAIITGLFAMIYKLLPRVRIEWRDVWVGSMVTSLLFAVGKLLIGLYLGKSGVASGFGAAGSLVIVLLWVYYSSQIFLLGAEFTKTYAHSHGSRTGQAMPSGAGAKAPQSGPGAPAEKPRAESPAPYGPAAEEEGLLAGYSRLRIAAGVAAGVGLVTGEIANALRERRAARRGRR
ncbi:MAG: YihY/virulence factor BrkB family protein [Betaproteobacteria bacterium]